EEGIRKGMYWLQQTQAGEKSLRVQLMGSGTILREVIGAAELLAKDFDIASDVWSATSFTELGRDGMTCERWNRMHPESAPRLSHVAQCLKDRTGPVVAASDYMRAFPEQIRPHLSQRFVTLGTDGFGRSDTRANLREFFEVNRHHVVIAALKALADEELIAKSKVSEAIKKYGVDAEKAVPWAA
ncbi:MAG: pyruvate dehydrogenase (acetyl-transferring), homodimeric type, partial [Burkholderiales bacterium]